MKLTRNTISRMISASLAAMLFLTACGNTTDAGNENTSAEKDSTSDTTTEESMPVLPERDFGGYEFTFLNIDKAYTYRSVVSEEQTGEPMNDAIYLRNRKVEDRYNIRIKEIDSGNPQQDFTKSVAAGDNNFDIGLLRMEWAFPIVLENGAMNWEDIPNIDIKKPWWIQSSISAMSLMNNVYFAVSQFDVSHYESVRAFLYNKRLVSEYNLESPYELVESGKWTLEKFHEQALIVSTDLDSNGKWGQNDQFGLLGGSNVICNTLMCGVGSILSIGKDENDMPYFNLDQNHYIDRLQAVAELFGNNDGFAFGGNGPGTFKDGRGLFLGCLLFETTVMRDMEDDFGILPTPKYNETQENYINLGGSPFFMTVPITTPDKDRTGAVMEALAYDSMGLIDTAYYDIILKGKASRDTESEKMLDLIFSTLEYYHPLANSYLNSPLADNYIWKGKTDFASYFASVKDKIQSDIDTAMKTYRENVG